MGQLTYGNYRELFRRVSGDNPSLKGSATDSRIWPDSTVRRAFNRAFARIVRAGRDADFYTASDTVNLVTGDIALPEGMQGDLLVLFSAGSTQPAIRLSKRTERWMDEKTPGWRTAPASSTPQYVVTKKLSGAWVYSYWPQPTATITNAIIRRWQATPAWIAEDGSDPDADNDTIDVLDLFPDFEETLPLYLAAAYLFRIDGAGNAELAALYDSLGERELKEFTAAMQGMFVNDSRSL